MNNLFLNSISNGWLLRLGNVSSRRMGATPGLFASLAGAALGRFASLAGAALLLVSVASCTDDTPDPLPDGEADNFAGNVKEFLLYEETAGLESDSCQLKILAPDGSIITRSCSHQRRDGESRFRMNVGLREGEYTLLSVVYNNPLSSSETADGSSDRREFGLGSSVQVSGTSLEVKSVFDKKVGMCGTGTADDPYIVSSYDHLMKLAHNVNSMATNSLFTEETHIRQIVDIDMDDACFLTDHRYGWEPIGNDTNLPFRGCYEGRTLSGIWSLRDHSPGIGLFGYIQNATIDGISIVDSEFAGNFAVGSVAGAVITAGASRDKSNITNCRVVNTKVEGSEGSVAIGGILGAADMRSMVMLYGCSNENSDISGDYNVGGLLGASAQYSLSSINDCSNTGRISAGFSGAGGITGTTDTLYVTSCRNAGEIIGGARYAAADGKNAAIGCGGISGGSGIAFLTACENRGKVSGHSGVGGILGSTRVCGDASTPYLYNNAAFRYCANRAEVSGKSCVGGINGESQFGCFGVINTARVAGGTYVGGIVGNTSIAVVHNAVNNAAVSGDDYVAGIVGKTTFGSIALDDNYGPVSSSGSHTAGIVSLAGNNTIMHYCGNHADVTNTAGKYVGGLAGEIGDPRKWTGMNVADCVIGATEVVMGIAGPCIAAAAHVMEGSLHALSIMLEFSEFAFDSLLHATDAVLIGTATAELIKGGETEEISAELEKMTLDSANAIVQEIREQRENPSAYSAPGMSSRPLYAGYGANANSLMDWYAVEGNDEIFNEAINEVREERMEAAEKAEKTKEIVQTCIGGVCLVAGTVASIGAIVATGGTATAFVMVGATVSVIGGVNAILKPCLEFEANAVEISQCVNSGRIVGNSGSGALVGKLQDTSLICDCLNTGANGGSGNTFVGSYGSYSSLRRCLNACTGWNGTAVGHDGSAVICLQGGMVADQDYVKTKNVVVAQSKMLADESIYTLADGSWEISDGSSTLWTILDADGSGYFYPVPAYSEMRKK